LEVQTRATGGGKKTSSLVACKMGVKWLKKSPMKNDANMYIKNFHGQLLTYILMPNSLGGAIWSQG